MVQPFGKLLDSISYRLTYAHPSISLLHIYPRKIKMCVHTETSTQMLRVTLFVIVPKWKQPKASSSG